MPMTLAEMRTGMSDKVAAMVVDTFIRESQLLELLPFDDSVSPGGGSTLTYSYLQKKLPSTAAFRALNTEYTPNQATLEKKSVDLKIFGGAFEIDRVINDAAGQYNNMQYQIEEKIRAAISTFHNAMINGDSSVDANSFDGLDKFLVGQDTEFNTDAAIDLSTMANLKTNADVFYEALLRLINKTNADALLLNADMITKIQTVARVLGYKTESEEAFGRTVTTLGERKVRLIDLGKIYSLVTSEGVTTTVGADIVGTKSRALGEGTTSVVEGETVVTPPADTTGLTDIYAVRFSVADGFHGVTITGDKAIRSFLPDFSTPGAVKHGEVEMVAACALKNTNAAGVLRNIKIL